MGLRASIREWMGSGWQAACAALSLAAGLIALFTVLGIIRATIAADPELPRPGNLFHVYGWNRSQSQFLQISYLDFQDLRNSVKDADLAAFVRLPVTVRLGGVPALLPAELVTSNYFRTLEARPAAGNLFDAAGPAAASPRVVLSFELWRSRFNADPKWIGTPIVVNDTVCTISGVAPATFRGTVLDWSDSPQVWIVTDQAPGLPWLKDALTDRSVRLFLIAGRLHSAPARAAVETALLAVSGRLANDYAVDRGTSVRFIPMRESRFWPAYRPKIRRTVGFLLGGAFFLLLLGVLNAAGLVWAKCLANARTYVMRIAFGASANSVFRLIWLQTLMLTLPGIVAGFAALPLMQAALTSLGRPFGIPLALHIQADWTTIAWASLAAVVVAAVVAALPVWDLMRLPMADLLRSRFSLATGWRTLTRYAILVVQAALSTMLLAVAGLAIAALLHLKALPLGFNPESLSVVRFQMPEQPATAATAAQALNDVIRALRSEPGISSAALCRLPPLEPSHISIYANAVKAGLNFAGPEYFHTLGVPMVLGREFEARASAPDEEPVIVNSVLARRLFGPADPIHRPILLQSISGRGEPVRAQVVGVVPELKYSSLSESDQPYVYRPFVASPSIDAAILVRGIVSPPALRSTVERFWRSRTESPVLVDVVPMHRLIDNSLAPERTLAFLTIFFGIAAALVAAGGVLSTTSRFAAENLKSVGIRLALGASAANVRWFIFRRTLVGTAAGIVLAVAVLFAFRSLLSATVGGAPSFRDVIPMVAAAQLLMAALAGAAPAFWSSRVSPVELLRHE